MLEGVVSSQIGEANHLGLAQRSTNTFGQLTCPQVQSPSESRVKR